MKILNKNNNFFYEMHTIHSFMMNKLPLDGHDMQIGDDFK